MTWLRARLRELPTWLGLTLILLATLVLCRHISTIAACFATAGASTGSILAVVTNEQFIKFGRVVLCFIFRARPTVLAGAPATQEKPMSVVTTIAEIVSESPDFIKVAQDGIAVAQAIEAKNFAAVVTGFPTYEADLVKAYNDIKALGVAQAVASGEVSAIATAA